MQTVKPAPRRETFTDKLLQSRSKLPVPASGQVDYWDKVTTGLGVRCSYGGKKSFVVLVRVRRPEGSKLIRHTIGSYPNVSLSDARVRAKRIIEDAQKGIGPKDREIEERNKAKQERVKTFGAVAQEFMRAHGSKLRTSYQIKRMIDVELLPAWADSPIASITRADVKELIRAKAQTAPISANRLASLISKVFNWAVDESIVTTSPAFRLGRNEEHERERSLTADEIAALWPAFDRLGYPFGRAMQLLLICGQRRGEVSNLKWPEIDGNSWKLPGTGTKSGKGHLVPLSTLALEIIESCPRLGEHVFTAGRGMGAIQGWHRAKVSIDASLATPIEPWKIHDLRRTAATQMRSLGIDRLIVSKILNHAEGGITKIYDRFADDAGKTAAMERWANKLREIIARDTGDNVVQMQKKLGGAA